MAQVPVTDLRVLFVEDSPDDVELIRLELARHGLNVRANPFIIVSGTIGEDSAVDAMRAVAKDYVLKHNPFTVEALLAKVRDRLSSRKR